MAQFFDLIKFAVIGAIAALLVFAAFFALAAHGSGAGVITLPDYPHAVVICGEALVVNTGHYADPQIAELVALAQSMCR